jgi:hypothetical protein
LSALVWSILPVLCLLIFLKLINPEDKFINKVISNDCYR